MWNDITHMQSLEREVAHLHFLLQPSAHCYYNRDNLRIAIRVLQDRIYELSNALGLNSTDEYQNVSSVISTIERSL